MEQDISIEELSEIYFIEDIVLLKPKQKSSTETLTLNETIGFVKAVYRTGTDTLTLTESIAKKRTTLTFSDTLSLTETVSLKKAKSLSAADTLTFTETANKNATLSLSVSETLAFKDGFVKNVGEMEVYFPVARLIKKDNFFLLKGTNRVVTLPNPNFGDTEANDAILTVYKSMSNKTYTYVKKQELKVINYSFVLSRNKSIELRNFLDIEIDNRIQFTNHKAEIWEGYILTNPVVFTTTKRAGPCGEQVELDLQFEVVRVF